VNQQRGKPVGLRRGEILLEEIRRAYDGAHVGIDVRDANAGRVGLVDLAMGFRFDLGHCRVRDDFGGEKP
jgi:hypothetical protein